MLRGLWKLTWLELKIFAREPLGFVGTVFIPVVVFVVLGRMIGRRAASAAMSARGIAGVDVPVLAALLITVSAVLSLVTIVAIYREGGILKRLRATPLRPHTILTAHVLVKLALTAMTMMLMVFVGRRYQLTGPGVPMLPFLAALLFVTVSILSLGFLIASVVPTARFSQPVGGLIFYPMLGLSGVFGPVEALPPTLQGVAKALPLTYAVSLLKGIWNGETWSAHIGDMAVLALVFIVCITLSSRVFRWE